MNSQDTTEVNKFLFKNEKKLDPNDWNCTKLGNDIICVPCSWKLKKQDKVYYFCYLSNNSYNSYFTIIKQDLNSQNIDINKYLKEIYSQLLNDTIEQGEGYTVKKLIFKNKYAYYCEYYTKFENKSFLTYSMLFEKHDFLYDVALKIEKDSASHYYGIFQNILYNFKVEGNPVFSINDELEKIQVVDLSTL
ncbi:MAG: hypothetical protein ACM3P1_05630 [Candidatus Saccharibacteria bacterium]